MVFFCIKKEKWIMYSLYHSSHCMFVISRVNKQKNFRKIKRELRGTSSQAALFKAFSKIPPGFIIPKSFLTYLEKSLCPVLGTAHSPSHHFCLLYLVLNCQDRDMRREPDS